MKIDYDYVWKQKRPSRVFRSSFLKKELDLFKEYKVKTVLDLGFGNGDNLLKLASLGYKVTGLDQSKGGIKVCKEKFQKFGFKGRFLNGDFYKRLPFKDSEFDAVYTYQAVCHNTLDQIRKVFGEVHRVLKKNSVFSVKDACDRVFVKKGRFYYLAPKLKRKLKLIAPNTYVPMRPDDPEKGVIHYEFSMKEMVKEIENAGFELINKRRSKRGMAILNFRKK